VFPIPGGKRRRNIVERTSQANGALFILIDGVDGESIEGYPYIGDVGFAEEIGILVLSERVEFQRLLTAERKRTEGWTAHPIIKNPVKGLTTTAAVGFAV
jgi:hypothetical protein